MNELPHSVRARIEDFLVDYVHTIDDDELEAWPSYFEAEGLYQIISREGFEAGYRIGVMTCQGRGMMIDRIRALRDANIFEPHRYCHVLSRSAITPADENRYAVRTNFQVVRTMTDGASDVFATGKYIDDVVFTEDALALASRHVVLDSRRVDTLLVIPL